MRTNGEQQDGQPVKIGALWAAKNGNPGSYTGSVEQEIPAGQRLIVSPNRYKRESKHPDLLIFLAAENGQQRRHDATKHSHDKQPANNASETRRRPADEMDDESIPF